MKTRFLLVILIGVVTLSAADPPPADDKKEIQGSWTLIALEINGKPIGDSVRGAGLKVIFQKDTITFKSKDGPDMPPTGNFKLDAKIDGTKKHKTIETTIGKDTELGIYELTGDTLRVCMARVGVDKPPTEFKTSEKDGYRLFSFKKEPDTVKDKDKEKAKDK